MTVEWEHTVYNGGTRLAAVRVDADHVRVSAGQEGFTLGFADLPLAEAIQFRNYLNRAIQQLVKARKLAAKAAGKKAPVK